MPGGSLADYFVTVKPDLDKFGPELKAKLLATDNSTGTDSNVVGKTIGREIAKGASTATSDGLKAALPAAITTAGGASAGAAQGAGITIAGTMTAALVVGIVAAVPVIAAATSVALVGGMGLSFIGLGAFILAKTSPHVQDAAKRLMEIAKEEFHAAAQPMMQPMVDAIKLTWTTLRTQLAPQFRSAFSIMASAVVPLTAGLLGFLTSAMPGFLSAMRTANGVVVALAQAMPRMGTALGDFFVMIGHNAPLLDRLTGVLVTWINNSFKVLGPLVYGLTVIFGDLVNTWRAFQILLENSAKTVGGWIGSAQGLAAAWHPLGEAIKTAWHAMENFATASSRKDILTTGRTLADALLALWNQLMTFLIEAWKRLWKEIVKWWDHTGSPMLKAALAAGLDMLIAVVLAKMDQLGASMVKKTNKAINGIVSDFLDLPAQVYVILDAFVVNTAARASALVAGIIRWLRTLPGAAVAVISGVGPGILNVLSNAANGAVVTVLNLVARVVGVFARLAGQVASALGNVPSAVIGALAGAGSWLYNAGQSVISGMINGIRNAASGLADAAANAARSALNAAKAAIGIQSPSKAFRDQVGRPAIEGLVAGVHAAMPNARSAVRDSVASLVPAARAGLSGAGSAGTDASDLLDVLTDIRELIASLPSGVAGALTGGVRSASQLARAR